jgi:hypothetical protein
MDAAQTPAEEDAGVIYCATRPAPNALFDTCFSITSLRRVYSGPITLMTDHPADRLRRMADALDLDVHSLDLEGDDRRPSRSVKTRMGLLSPYRRTVWLDSDTIVLKPIDRLFEVDLGMALDVRRTIADSMKFLRESISDIIEEEARLTDETLPPDFPQYNSGVLAWKKSPDSDRLFEAWHQEWLRFQHRDQAALARAIHLTKTKVETLPREYNYFSEYGGPKDDREIVIWHACRPADHEQREFPEIYEQTRRFVAKTFEVVYPRSPANRVPTEANAYELLRRDPVFEENCIDVPWVDLILERDLDDRTVRRRLRRIKVEGGFTICQHIDYAQIIPICKRMGVDTLFTPHAVEPGSDAAPRDRRGALSRIADRLRGDANRPLRVLSFPHLAVHGADPGTKDLLYSFVGCATHPCREPIFALPDRPDALVIRRGDWHFYGTDQEQAEKREEYRQILSRSRFSLCPRGTGPSTIRFWESLQAGAIPVLISDDHLLPEGYDWDRCVVRIAEKDVADVASLIESIPPETEESMRSECLTAYALFSGDNLVRCIRVHYDPSQGRTCAE